MTAKQMIKTNEDHDLLIELRTEMVNVRRDIKDLNDGTISRIKDIEINKADIKEVEELQKKVNGDIENRLRIVESSKTFYATSMIIYTAVGVSMIGFMLIHILKG